MEKLPVLPEENLILIDWFTFTVRGLEISYVKEILLGLSVSWEEIEHYMNGYPKRLYFGGISIMYGGTDEMGICVNFSGQGCRTFETYSCITWNDLFAVVLSKCAVKTGNITRLDVAFDDHSGILNLTRMQHDCEQDLIVSKFRKWSIEYGSDRSMCIYHGSKKSDIMIRIYDKAVERGYDDDTHWVRVEMQLRDDLASSFACVEMMTRLQKQYPRSKVISNFGLASEDDELSEWQQLLDYTNGHKGVIVGIDEIQNWFMSGRNQLPEGT